MTRRLVLRALIMAWSSGQIKSNHKASHSTCNSHWLKVLTKYVSKITFLFEVILNRESDSRYFVKTWPKWKTPPMGLIVSEYFAWRATVKTWLTLVLLLSFYLAWWCKSTTKSRAITKLESRTIEPANECSRPFLGSYCKANNQW
jgi:hypothetical protein